MKKLNNIANHFNEIKEAQVLTLSMQDKVKQYTKLAQLAED